MIFFSSIHLPTDFSFLDSSTIFHCANIPLSIHQLVAPRLFPDLATVNRATMNCLGEIIRREEYSPVFIIAVMRGKKAAGDFQGYRM